MSYIRRNDAEDIGKTLGYLFLDFKQSSFPKKIIIVAGITFVCGMFYLALSEFPVINGLDKSLLRGSKTK